MFQPITLVLAEQVVKRLSVGGRMLATAESCTGGLVAGAITAIAGSSVCFDRGYITYSNDAKMQEIGVRDDTLATHGAVSEATALEMAIGALEGSQANVAVSTTGIAGPGGATPGKPVGMVCFAWAWESAEGRCTRVLTDVFPGDRTDVRDAAVQVALRGLLDIPAV